MKFNLIRLHKVFFLPRVPAVLKSLRRRFKGMGHGVYMTFPLIFFFHSELLYFRQTYCLVSIISLSKIFLSKAAFPKTWSKALKQKDNAWLIEFLKGRGLTEIRSFFNCYLRVSIYQCSYLAQRRVRIKQKKSYWGLGMFDQFLLFYFLKSLS